MNCNKKLIFLLNIKILFLSIFSCISNEKISDNESSVIVTVDYFIAYEQRVNLTVPSSRIIDQRDSSYRTFTITGNASSFTLTDANFSISNYNTPLSDVKESSPLSDDNSILNNFLGINSINSLTITSSTTGYITVLCNYSLYHLIEIKKITETGIFVNWKTQLNGSNRFLE